MIVGTAGHIDHGKTTLVRALTGVDTDRLAEEKRRGISIELGYAYVPLSDERVLGFVDVPGHERLIHTMVAGASGIDFALLVVAADDGVMPQTREHLAILELLGVTRGAIALTKCDRVDRERARAAADEIAATLATTRLRDAALFQVNALRADDAGLHALREHLHAQAQHEPPRTDTRLFRMAVDRVFSLAGHGTIATGTVHAGSVCVGDTVAIMPSAVNVRVRGVHAQDRATQSGHAGQRCAINLAGVDTTALARGDWLADARALLPTCRIDVRLHLLDAVPKRLADGSTVHVHLGTAHRLAHIVLLDAPALDVDTLDAGTLDAGARARVQLVFDAPLCATSGDRFIVRDAQAAHTLGGGVVLDPYAPERKRRSAQRLHYLDALEHLLAGAGFADLLAQAPFGLHADVLMRLSGRAADAIELPPGALTLRAGHDHFVIHADHFRAWRAQAIAALQAFHRDAPDEAGIDGGRLRRQIAPAMPQTVWRLLVAAWLAEKAIAHSGAWLRLPQHRIEFSAADELLAERLQPLLRAGGFDPPWVRDLAQALRTPEAHVRQTLRKMLGAGRVYQIVADLFYPCDSVRALAAVVAELGHEQGAVSAAAFRDASGLGRKRAVQILEFFDRVGYTRRVRDAHRLRHDEGAERF